MSKTFEDQDTIRYGRRLNELYERGEAFLIICKEYMKIKSKENNLPLDKTFLLSLYSNLLFNDSVLVLSTLLSKKPKETTLNNYFKMIGETNKIDYVETIRKNNDYKILQQIRSPIIAHKGWKTGGGASTHYYNFYNNQLYDVVTKLYNVVTDLIPDRSANNPYLELYFSFHKNLFDWFEGL